jgi:hypothetical protein
MPWPVVHEMAVKTPEVNLVAPNRLSLGSRTFQCRREVNEESIVYKFQNSTTAQPVNSAP